MIKKLFLKKQKGSFILQISAFYIVIFLVVFSLAAFTRYRLNGYGQISVNALNSANLSIFSSKIINLDILSQSPSKKVIIIKDPQAALQTWEDRLKFNLNLDNNYMPKYSSSFILSKVDINQFILYNVNDFTKDVTVYTLNPTTGEFDVTDYPNSEGELKTPNGNVVNITTLHTDIGFTINVIGGQNKYVHISRDNGAYKN